MLLGPLLMLSSVLLLLLRVKAGGFGVVVFRNLVQSLHIGLIAELGRQIAAKLSLAAAIRGP